MGSLTKFWEFLENWDCILSLSQFYQNRENENQIIECLRQFLPI